MDGEGVLSCILNFHMLLLPCSCVISMCCSCAVFDVHDLSLLHAFYHVYTLHILHTLHIQIPAALYDLAIKQLQTMDPEAVDTLLKRKCMDQGYVYTTHSATSIKCSHCTSVYTLPSLQTKLFQRHHQCTRQATVWSRSG